MLRKDLWPRAVLVLILSVLPCLSGCWDVEEVTRRGIANAVYFDAGAGRKIKMGVALTIPGTQVPPNTGTFQQFAKRNFIISGEGVSAVDAWTKIQSNTSRNIFFGQTRAIILSEKVARTNINDVMDFIGRVPLVPPNTNVLVTKTDPEELLNLQNQNNEAPGNYIDFYFRSPLKRSLAIPVDLWLVEAILDRKTGDPYLPLIAERQKDYYIAGTALFSRTRFVAELSLDETQTLALIKGAGVGYRTVPWGRHQLAAFENIRARTGIKPKLAPDGTLTYEIRTKIQGVLVEQTPHWEIAPEQKRAIETEARRIFHRKIRRLLAKLQALNSDPAQFGNEYRIAYPRRWKHSDWHQVYPTVKFKVRTQFTVKETGLFR